MPHLHMTSFFSPLDLYKQSLPMFIPIKMNLLFKLPQIVPNHFKGYMKYEYSWYKKNLSSYNIFCKKKGYSSIAIKTGLFAS